jgi:DNA-binding FadR family transcriptional regulator
MKNERASDKVFDYIEKRIVNGTWKQGDQITPELQLVEKLGVSRISVREAIQKLASMEILVKKRGGGTFVNKFNSSNYMKNIIPLLTIGELDYREIMEFRTSIDVLGVKLFIKRADDDKLEKLQKIYENMEKNIDNPKKFFKYDMEFHREISKSSGNKILKKVTEMIFDILTYNLEEEYHNLPYSAILEEHRLIINAIKKRDAELAALYTERHIEKTMKFLETIQEV